MEKKDFKKGQKAILLFLKNVDFRKTMYVKMGFFFITDVTYRYI